MGIILLAYREWAYMDTLIFDAIQYSIQRACLNFNELKINDGWF